MRRLPVVLAVALVGGALGAAPVTLARFHASADTTASFGTATVEAPTGLDATTDGTTVTLTWTPSSTASAEGYTVYRGDTAGGPYAEIAAVTPGDATTTTDAPGTGTWYYVLRTVLGNWTSDLSGEASATVGSSAVSTPFTGCSSNGSSSGGDGNGYESNPARGCATDGLVAVDNNSGTNTSLSCASTGKDRHRFWGYSFGLPGSVSSIDGITLQLRAGQSNNGGTTLICAQLSWDGGTSWTSLKQVNLTANSLATYTLGGSADTWGRAWTRDEVNSTSGFRIRLVDVSSQSAKDFRLDSATVRVTYTP